MENGATAEVATIGREGVIGAGVFFGDEVSAADTIVQVTRCIAYRLSIDRFMGEMERHGALYNRVTRYTQALLAQVMQHTACNCIHSAEQRCCRWLLVIRDCLGTNDLKMTHEYIVSVLGLRRPTVTLVINRLQRVGVIDMTRLYIRIVDQSKLEATSCECYGIMKFAFHRLLPEIPVTGGSRPL
jgi:CRP-like cAMP-binding protein